MTTGVSETTIVLKVLELAQRQGWLDRLLLALRKKQRVLVLGSSGAGKSMFLESLTETLPTAISRLNRTEFAQKHAIKIGKSPFEFFDTPGQVLHKERRMAAIRDAMAKPIAGIINVTAYGFHEGKIEKKHAIDGGKARESYLAGRRQEEIEALREWLPLLGSRDTTGWLITAVTKADLWWGDREKVMEHYSTGAYGAELANAKELRPVVIEYCSVFQPYFGEAPMDGTFGDADRTRAKGHLMKQLLAAVGKEKS